MPINPYGLPMQQAQLAREQQLVQQGQNKGGFFDNLGTGMQLPTGGASPMGMPGYLRQQLLVQNLMSPNQIQAGANNTGLMLGAALSKMFGGGKDDQAQMDPEQSEQMYRVKGAQAYAQAVKSGMKPVDAMKKVALDLISGGSDTGNAGMISAGQKMHEEYISLASKLKTIEDFTPRNMQNPKTGDVLTATSQEQVDQFNKMGYRLAGEESLNDKNPDVREVPHGTEVWTQVLKKGRSGESSDDWSTIAKGTRTQLTGEIPKREDSYNQLFADTHNLLDGVEKVEATIKSNPSAASDIGRAVVNFAGGITGTIQSLAPGMDVKLLDASNYQDVLGGKKDAIVASGLTEAALVRIATLQAAQEKFATGESNRLSAADIKLKLRALGANLSNPAAFGAVLQDVKASAVGNVGNKLNTDMSLDTYPWAGKARANLKRLQDRIKPTRNEDQSVDDFLKSLPSYK